MGKSSQGKPAQLPPKRLIVSAISLALTAGYGNAVAAEESTNKAEVEALPGMAVEGEKPDTYKVEKLSSPKYTLPLLDTPQSVTVIPNQVIKEQGVDTLRDVLRNVSGISITAGEGNPPSGDQLKLRGFNARDDIFLDGARDIGNYFRDPFNIEQVEVSKGPSSSYSGRGSTAGNINMVSKTPQLDSFLEGTATLGTDQTKRITADVNQQLDKFGLGNAAFRLNLMAHDSEVTGRDEVENQRWGIAPSLSFGIGTPTRVTLSYFHMTQDNLPDYGIPTVRDATFSGSPHAGEVAPVNYENFYGYTRRDYEDIESDIATFKFEHDFNDRVSLRNQFRYARLHNDSIVSAPRIRDDGDGQITSADTIRGNGKPRDQIEEFIINQTDLTTKFSTGFMQHTLVTGIEFAFQDAENRRRLDADGYDTDLFNPNPDLPIASIPYNGTRAELNTDSLAVYAGDTIKLHEQWYLTGGVRWDHVETEVRGIDTTGAFPGYVQNLEKTDTAWSWRTGLTFKPLPNGSIYFGYGNSFDPVASASVTSGVVQLAGGNNNPPANPATFFVDPEETETFELGTKWELLDNRLLLNAAIFRIEKTNARNPDPLLPGVVNLNGRQRVDGFELGFAGSVTDKWNVFGNYTYLDSEVLESDVAGLSGTEGSEIDNTPRNTFNLWTTYLLPYQVTVGGGVQFVDERTNSVGTTQIPVTVDSYWLLDAMASYPLTSKVNLRLNAYNLTDEEYIEQLGSGQAVPGAGRTALFSVDVKFY